MPARQHRDQRQADDVILAANDFAQRIFQLCRAVDAAIAVSGDIEKILLCAAEGSGRLPEVTNVTER